MKLKFFLITVFPLFMVFAASLAILIIKAAYLYKDFRFIPFGFDSARIIGYTQQLLQFKILDPDASYRYGLPLFAGFFVKVLSLSPSQTFTIPHWVINVGGGLLLMLTAWYLTKRKEIAVLSLVLYSSFAEGALVNDSYFMNLIVAPLRLLFLFILTSLYLKTWQKGLAFLIYSFFVIYSNLTYPIISLPLDVITIGYIYYLLINNVYLRKRFILIIIIQLLAYALIFVFYRLGAGHPLAINKYFEYIYALNALKLNHWFVAKVVLSFVGFELVTLFLMIMNFRLFQKRRIILPKLSSFRLVLFRIWQSLNKVLVGIGVGVFLLAGINHLIPSLKIFSNFLSLPGINLLTNWWVLALILVIQRGRKRILGQKLLPFRFIVFTLSCFIVLYLLFPGDLVLKVIRNKRLVVFFLPYIFIIFSAGLVKLKKPLFLTLVSLFIILSLVDSLREIKRYFRFPARQATLNAMDWFYEQPDHTNVLFYATYFNSPNLTEHEKYYGLYFSSSQIPFKDQRLLGKCIESEEICTQNYIDYIKSNKVRYLVLEYGDGSFIFEKLSQLGEIVHDTGVRIVKI